MPAYNLRMTRDMGTYRLGLLANAQQDGHYTVNLETSFGLGHDPRTHRLHASSRPQASNGAVSARVFLDENRNSAWDAGERLLDQARVAASASQKAITGADGSRQPSAVELEGARFQGRHVAQIATKLAG